MPRAAKANRPGTIPAGARIGDMPSAVEKIRKAALELSQKQRAALAYDLLRSLDAEPAEDPQAVEAAWDQEVARRVEEVEAGRVALIPGEEVAAAAREVLARRRRR